jgi:hypothetical protein
MKFFSLLTLAILLNTVAHGQKEQQSVTLYPATREFLNDDPIPTEAFALVERLSDNHLKIKKFVDGNGKKIKGTAFAIKYDGESYFNLFYSIDLNNIYYYAKFDIIGRYCAVIIDENTPAPIRNGGTSYPLGAAGALMKDSVKWGKAWLDKDGKKKRILFIDTLKYEPGTGARNGASIGNYLTRSQLTDILKAHKIDIEDKEAKDLSFEEVIRFINEMNATDKA